MDTLHLRKQTTWSERSEIKRKFGSEMTTASFRFEAKQKLRTEKIVPFISLKQAKRILFLLRSGANFKAKPAHPDPNSYRYFPCL
jgi:hypothetical protein